ncbi:MAG: LamG-like jellyroll fold domain-containing protein [bacterium]
MDTESGAVDFWLQLLYPITDPIYDDWNLLLHYPTDEGYLLGMEFGGDRIYGTTYLPSGYVDPWVEQAPDWGPGQWHHLAFCWSAVDSLLTVYYDGRLVGQAQGYYPPPGQGDRFYIGSDEWGGRQAYASIDEFRLHNRFLTESEVAALYRYGWVTHLGETVLDSTHFAPGDTIVFQYIPKDGGSFGDPANSPPLVVEPVPILDSGPPSGLLAAGTSTLELFLLTTQAAECRWGESSQVPYHTMTRVFSGLGTTHHSFVVNGLSDGEYLNFGVKCSCWVEGYDPDGYSLDLRYRVLLPYNPPFPRIANHRTNFDPAIPLDFYAGYDYIDVAPWDITQAEIDAIHTLNPHVKILATLDATYGGPLQDRALTAQPGEPEYNWLLRNTAGAVILIDFCGHPMFNLTDTTLADYMADFNYERFLDCGLAFDGIFFDRIHQDISWFSDDIDSDLNGVADDPADLDSRWLAGMYRFLSRLREHLPHAVITGNDAALIFTPYLNGREYEWETTAILDFSEWGVSWDSLLAGYLRWNEEGLSPAVTFIITSSPTWLIESYGLYPREKIPPDSLEWARTRYGRVRFGLCTALMGDGLSMYDFGTTWHGNLWWYDEYDVNLGYPSGEAYKYLDATVVIDSFDFEDGTATGFRLNNWNGMSASVTSDPGEVVAGNYSIKGTNTDPEGRWNEFLHTDPGVIGLDPLETYTVSFDYKILAEAVQGCFYFLVRTQTGGEEYDTGGLEFDPPIGVVGSQSVSFTLGDFTDYYLIFGIEYDGSISVDNITISRGEGGVWRRDFDNGMALVNSSPDSVPVALEGPYRKLAGLQAPDYNDGSLVTSLVLPGHDGIILLKELPPTQKGDVNSDGQVSILDVVLVINIILGTYEPTSDQLWAADMNDDGSVDILDVVEIVNEILGEI